MSNAIIENGRIQVTDGYLKSREDCIRKINRHKRWAEIEVEMFGTAVSTRVVLEAVRKS